MYQSLLTRRYLFSKAMPLLAAVAIMLCSGLVLITWSVMGGFLKMLVNSGRTMAGDVTVAWPNAGFPHYEELAERLRKDPAIEAAAPTIEAFGLIGLPDGRNETVMFRGVAGESYASVTRYRDILWWQPLDKPLPKDKERLDPRLNLPPEACAEMYEAGLVLKRDGRSAAVLGIHVSGFNLRNPSGFYDPMVVRKRTPDGRMEDVDTFLPRDGTVTLNVLPLDASGKVVDTVTQIVPVANEFHSGVFEMDEKIVLVDLGLLQRMLNMHEARRAVPAKGAGGAAAAPKVEGEPEDFATGAAPTMTVVDPPRATHILVKGKGAVATPEETDKLKERVREVYALFAAAHPGQVPDEYSIRIVSWRDQNSTMINAVEKETALVLFLFALISFVCVILILTIFWSMISEKTRDIGILRAIGAGKTGVAWLWVRYGVLLGVVGASAGIGVAYLVVLNINPIHDWMGAALGLVIWDPKIYYFSKIPNEVEPMKAAIVLVGFIVSGTVGALVPAVRAARLNPVQALRFE